MQFTKEEIQDILRENEQLKKDILAVKKEQEATERLYDLMVAGTKNIMMLTDGGARSAVYVSPNVEEQLGLPRELVMSDIRELGPASGDIPCRELFPSSSKEGELVRSDVECIDRRTGKSRAYHRSVTRFEGVDGKDRFLTVLLDAESGTADNSRLHEILYDGVIAANTRMLKGMSHDLRTPLNSIAGFVMLLLKNADNPAKVQEYAHRIGMSSQDLLVMINQIMDLGGSQLKGQEVLSREFALGKTIEEITGVIRNKAQIMHQSFEVRTSGIEHDIFIGDRARITEVLMNLLNNAIQYTPEGGEITLTVIGRQDGEPEYRDIFIAPSELPARLEEGSLVVVVDTSRPEQVEAPALLSAGAKVAVIDHHRVGATYIQDAALGFIEPYASSACELVSEILQELPEASAVLRCEADALLAGIVLDTKSFTMRTGERTFDAAAWLRRMGADTAAVKRLLQLDLDGAVAKYKILQLAEIYRGIAVAAPEEPQDRVVAAQAADELLNIAGVDASVVVAPDGKGGAFASARSIGDVNVQLIMEALGGGGNRSAAAAQFSDTGLQDAVKKLYDAIDNYLS